MRRDIQTGIRCPQDGCSGFLTHCPAEYNYPSEPDADECHHCAECGYETDRTTRWRSVAVWPDAVRVGNIAGRSQGFGGNGETFPLSTRVEVDG